MKKIILYLIVTTTVMISACSKLLDIEPTDAISSEEAIKDRSGVEKALTGAYDALQLANLYGRNRVILGDLSADNLVWSGTSYDYAQLDNNSVSIENGIIDGTWAGSYDGINRVNNILYALPGIGDLTDAEFDQYEGEAMFLRALFHFNLLIYFGGVPVITEPTLNLENLDRPRNTEAEIYDQIISDLEAAETRLLPPNEATAGRASSFSATALLARVYLTRYHAENSNEYAIQAVNMADKVIGQGSFSLDSSYAALFKGTDNSERIFQVAFSAQDKNRLAEYFLPISQAGRYEVAPDEAFALSYDPADSIRLKATIAIDADGFLYGIKYTELVEGSDPVLVIRLAEMYLIKAEALAYTNGDINAIKENIDVIRTRAKLGPTPATTYDELKLAIENERRFEFAFEGHRWFDLVRTKRATTVLGIDEDYTLFPIPLSEMSTNQMMTQNPGY